MLTTMIALKMNDLTATDYFALIFFLISIFGYGWLTLYGPLKNDNISSGVQKERKKWINTMIERENRMVDMIILTNLSQGNAFFGSTAIVIVGALAASLSGTNEFSKILTTLPFATATTPDIVNLKLIFIMIIFLVAFFKFAWAFRLTHYTSIMMGATPIKDASNHKDCHEQASRTIQLAGRAGMHSNGGLHAYYYGFAAFGWFISPWIFIMATALIICVLYRREYISKSHDIINQGKFDNENRIEE